MSGSTGGGLFAPFQLDQVMSEFDKTIQMIFSAPLPGAAASPAPPTPPSPPRVEEPSPTANLLASSYYTSSPYAFPTFGDKTKTKPAPASATIGAAPLGPTTDVATYTRPAPHYCSKWRKYSNVGTDANGKPLRIRHYCAVRHCTVNEYTHKPGTTDKYHFYRVPQKDMERRMQWVKILRPEDPFWDPSLGSRVCERHFESGNPGRFGFPSLNLTEPDASSQTPTCGCNIGSKRRKAAATAASHSPSPAILANALAEGAAVPTPPQSNNQAVAASTPFDDKSPAAAAQNNLLFNQEIPPPKTLPSSPPKPKSPAKGPKPQSTMSKDGILVKAEDVEVVAGRVASFRSTMELLAAQLKADEALLAKIAPAHPLVVQAEAEAEAEVEAEVPVEVSVEAVVAESLSFETPKEEPPSPPKPSPAKLLPPSPKKKGKTAISPPTSASPPISESEASGRNSRSKKKRPIASAEIKVEEKPAETVETKRRRSSSRLNSKK